MLRFEIHRCRRRKIGCNRLGTLCLRCFVSQPPRGLNLAERPAGAARLLLVAVRHPAGAARLLVLDSPLMPSQPKSHTSSSRGGNTFVFFFRAPLRVPDRPVSGVFQMFKRASSRLQRPRPPGASRRSRRTPGRAVLFSQRYYIPALLCRSLCRRRSLGHRLHEARPARWRGWRRASCITCGECGCDAHAARAPCLRQRMCVRANFLMNHAQGRTLAASVALATSMHGRMVSMLLQCVCCGLVVLLCMN